MRRGCLLGGVLFLATGCEKRDRWAVSLRGDWVAERFDWRHNEVPYHSGDPLVLVDERDYPGEVRFHFDKETTDQGARWHGDWRTGTIELPDGYVVDFDWGFEEPVGEDASLWMYFYEDAIFAQGGWDASETSITGSRSEVAFRNDVGGYILEADLVLVPE